MCYVLFEYVHLHVSSSVQWEVKQPIPSPAFKTITKQIVKLHENLVDILPSSQLKV